MTTITTAELCRGLRVSRARVDQLISRGIITPSDTPGPGLPRRWTFQDAMQLAIHLDLGDTFETSIEPTKRIALAEGENTYLVAARETLSLISSVPRGTKAKPPIPAGLTDRPRSRIVREADLPEVFADAQHTPIIIINLSALAARLRAFWPAQ